MIYKILLKVFRGRNPHRPKKE